MALRLAWVSNNPECAQGSGKGRQMCKKAFNVVSINLSNLNLLLPHSPIHFKPLNLTENLTFAFLNLTGRSSLPNSLRSTLSNNPTLAFPPPPNCSRVLCRRTVMIPQLQPAHQSRWSSSPTAKTALPIQFRALLKQRAQKLVLPLYPITSEATAS